MEPQRQLMKQHKELSDQIATTEVQIIDALQRNDKAAVAAAEQREKLLKQQQLDVSTLMTYYEQKGDALNCAELHSVAFTTVRTSSSALRDEVELRRVVAQDIGEKNHSVRVTGLMVATSARTVCILEGPRKATLERMKEIGSGPINQSYSLLVSRPIESRQWQSCMALELVQDGLLSLLVEHLTKRVAEGKKYAPWDVVDLVERGGDCRSGVPHAEQCIVMTVGLDSKCGYAHHAEKYSRLSVVVEDVARSAHGLVVERFGDRMVAVFPVVHTSTPVLSCAQTVVDSQRGVVVALCAGEVTVASSPLCGAFGGGMEDGSNLLRICEEARRPLVVTPGVYALCSKAKHRFAHFTIETELFYTLQQYEDTRLEVAAPPLVKEYTVPRPCVPLDEVAPTSRPRDTKIREEAPPQGTKVEPMVRGAVTEQRLKEMFRTLDVGNCGWISKDKFRHMLVSSAQYPLFTHDLARVDEWLEAYNSLGETRLSFSEFCVIVLRLEQQ